MSVNIANAFAALQKTSKKDKEKEKQRKKEKKEKKKDKQAKELELENAIFSQPSISVSNWADCDDEDDDMAMPPLPVFDDGEVSRLAIIYPSFPSAILSDRFRLDLAITDLCGQWSRP